MKNLQQICSAATLSLVLSVPVFAGWMPNGNTGTTTQPPTPPPASTEGEIHNPVPGEVPTPPAASSTTTDGEGVAMQFITTASAVLRGMLTLF